MRFCHGQRGYCCFRYSSGLIVLVARVHSSFSNCCGFKQDAIRHADRLANAGRLRSSEGDVAVTAFAVYIQINRSPLTSELDASHCCFVCAWLIANAQIPAYISKDMSYNIIPPQLVHLLNVLVNVFTAI